MASSSYWSNKISTANSNIRKMENQKGQLQPIADTITNSFSSFFAGSPALNISNDINNSIDILNKGLRRSIKAKNNIDSISSARESSSDTKLNSCKGNINAEISDLNKKIQTEKDNIVYYNREYQEALRREREQRNR